MAERVPVLGVGVHAIGLQDLLAQIVQVIRAGRRLLVMSANVRALNLAWEQPSFRHILNAADCVFCDGEGVRWGARLLGAALPERFTPADWAWDLARRAAEQGFALYLLGSRPGVAQRAAERLQQATPGLRIAGWQHGYFDKTAGGAENRRVLEQVNAAAPQILLVGFGMPLQERWLAENWSLLQANVAITCGALFEYLSGDLRRGPRWMTDHGLEWLARMLISPRRYAGRYLRDLPLFLARLLWLRWRGPAALPQLERGAGDLG